MPIFYNKKNNANSTLAVSDIDDSQVTLEVTDATQFPDTPDFIITVWDNVTYPDPGDDSGMEVLKVTGISSNTFTVERGQESTTGVSHQLGDKVAQLFTVGQIEEIEEAFDNYLAKDNTDVYTPTLNYHPTTKLYVDSQIQGENHWDLESGNVLVPYVANASVNIGTGDFTTLGTLGAGATTLSGDLAMGGNSITDLRNGSLAIPTLSFTRDNTSGLSYPLLGGTSAISAVAIIKSGEVFATFGVSAAHGTGVVFYKDAKFLGALDMDGNSITGALNITATGDLDVDGKADIGRMHIEDFTVAVTNGTKFFTTKGTLFSEFVFEGDGISHFFTLSNSTHDNTMGLNQNNVLNEWTSQLVDGTKTAMNFNASTLNFNAPVSVTGDLTLTNGIINLPVEISQFNYGAGTGLSNLIFEGNTNIIGSTWKSTLHSNALSLAVVSSVAVFTTTEALQFNSLSNSGDSSVLFTSGEGGMEFRATTAGKLIRINSSTLQIDGDVTISDGKKIKLGSGLDTSIGFVTPDLIINNEGITTGDLLFTNFDKYVFDNTIEATTIDFGTNTIDDGVMVGNWDFILPASDNAFNINGSTNVLDITGISFPSRILRTSKMDGTAKIGAIYSGSNNQYVHDMNYTVGNKINFKTVGDNTTCYYTGDLKSNGGFGSNFELINSGLKYDVRLRENTIESDGHDMDIIVRGCTMESTLNGAITETNDILTVDCVGGFFGTGTLSTNPNITGTPIINFIGGDFFGQGRTLAGSGTAVTTSIGGRFNASGSTTNWAIFVVAGETFLGNDNEKTYWGTAKDVSLKFDGSDMIINSENVTASDEIHFTNFDKYTFDNDVVLPKTSGVGIKVDISAPTFGFADIIGDQFAKNTGATKPILTTYNGVINAWKFEVNDEAFITYHIPHDYVAGTPIFLHVHWSHIATTVTGGNVTFKLTSISAKAHNQEAFQSSPLVGTFTANVSTIQYQQILSEIQYSDSSPTGLEINTATLEPDSVIELTFEVDANNITVSSGGVPDIFIHYVDIHYSTTGLIGTKQKAPDFYV